MDRQLTKQEINSSRRRTILKLAIPAGVIAAIAIICLMSIRKSVNREGLQLGAVDTGAIESSLHTSGKVVPAFEEIITSPIQSRVVEIYRQAGDILEEGTPLLRLDLADAETELKRQRDSRQQQVYALEQQRLSDATEITNLEMEIKVKEMTVNQLKAEVENERRLDELGSGTGDRVREAELAYKTACIQLDQLRSRLENERKMRNAGIKGQELTLNIAERDLSSRERTLESARLKSPRAATLTYIINSVGQQVAPGEKVAVIADLSNFKIDAEISESNAKFLSPGGKAKVKIAKKVYPGTVINVAPVAVLGAVTFSVVFDDSISSGLRSGLAAEVHVLRDVKEDVMRLPMGSYYNRGPGVYELYVEHNPGILEKRDVELGDAGYDFVEVRSGLVPGDKVVINDASALSGNKIKING